MKTSKVKIFVIILLSFTIIVAFLHLNTREDIAEGTLLLSIADKSVTIDISEFAYKQVTGVRMNGKGEEIEVNASGISLKNILEQQKIKNYTKVLVLLCSKTKCKIFNIIY